MADPGGPLPARATTAQRANAAVPVGLMEAGLDSPSFRAAAVHFGDQVEAIEKWLDGYVRSTSKLVHDMQGLEDSVNSYLSKMAPPLAVENALDGDYTLLALRRAADGARDWWAQSFAAVRRLETTWVEPVRHFVANDVRLFKEARRAAEAAQKTFDTTLARYMGQTKAKEASALREDAFAAYETRKAYLKASLDMCQLAPQLRFALDKLLVRACADTNRDLRRSRDTGDDDMEMARLRGWSREMEASEAVFRRALQTARRDMGESMLATYRPSRELEDYSASTVPLSGRACRGEGGLADRQGSLQGWLFLFSRVAVGKNVRTNWVRRWYYCRDGVFGWLVQGAQGVLQGDELGVLLCSVKPAVHEERRFCFEVKTKTTTLLLQAETQTQLVQWLECFELAKNKALEASMGRDRVSGGVDPAFSITPSPLPEFSAKLMETGDDLATSAGQDGVGAATRASVDVSTNNVSGHVYGSVDKAAGLGSGRLAPLTLARPPMATSLSRQAMVVGGAERAPTMPSGVVANFWGSGPEAFARTAKVDMVPQTPQDETFLATVQAPAAKADTTFPAGYPTELRLQHALFRLLFPWAPGDEKLVLVFNAAWTSTSADAKDDEARNMSGHGRVFVTPDTLYFYGHQMGIVVAYAVSLDVITEVTAAPGKDCDFIYLHLGRDASDTGLSRISLSIFLEDLALLQSRLNLLVDDLQSEEPMQLEQMVEALQRLERDGGLAAPSPSVESWEDVSANTPVDVDDGTATAHQKPARQTLRVPKPVAKPQRPAGQVAYEPEGMGPCVAERHFEVGAKACFHVLFGDKSFIFPKLYLERRAKQVAQGPWTLADHGTMRREFNFTVDQTDMLGRKRPGDVTDWQTIDVFDDHVCYVVTHVKTPWHLPHAQAFKLVTQLVVTHVAKSKCKLALFTKVDWAKTPAFAKNMVQRQALNDAANDADELAEVATDQVRKLGPHLRTKRAVHVYGSIGRQPGVVVFTPTLAAAAASASASSSAVARQRPRTLTHMLLETGRSLVESVITSIMMGLFVGLRSLFAVLTAHRLLLLLLAFSALANLLTTSRHASTWWAERRAVRYMDRLGVGPNLVMSKAIYLVDLEDAARGTVVREYTPETDQCYSAFRTMVNSTDLDGPIITTTTSSSPDLTTPATKATARRLRRHRQRLAAYRHDLLVAMRVVNGVETELLRSEWESWLVDETARCELARPMLTPAAASALNLSSSVEGTQHVLDDGHDYEKMDALRTWHEEYCGSCEAERTALAAARRASSAFVT